MKFSKNLVVSFVLLILIASLYRILPGRPWGFAPQIAMALFAGSVIKDKKYAFALPLLSMFLSDLFYHALYLGGIGTIPGFYSGQFLNYLMLTSITVLGFFIKERNVPSMAIGFLAGPTAYFLISNFAVWIGGGGYQRPKTFDGLMMCYADGLPFYQMSVLSTFVFGAVLFSAYHLVTRSLSVRHS
ncbi:MAG TPA: DUF6580 family putative transport protein [Chitinophagaceae bacterium]|nr:DUF6580 family putative transport protein [Chitinophagaceae bacterium]